MAKMNSFERKAAVCATTVFLGAIIGGGLGGKQGAVIGGGIGAGACALFTLLDPYDKQRIKETQVNAVSLNQPMHESWVGTDGKQRAVSVNSPEPVTVAQHNEQICRKISTTLQIDNQKNNGTDIYCRDQNGDWYPLPPEVASSN